MQPTQVLVRVQAKGGKFVGPDGGYTQVTLRDAQSGAVLAQGVAAGGSGQLSGAFSPAATRQAIVTPLYGTQTVLWLSATPGQPTAGLTASLQLDAPTRVEFSAAGITDGQPNGHTVAQTMYVQPGVDLTAEPGVVLVLPGLIVKDVAATATPDGASVGVTAFVSMMCGCKIDPSLPWLPQAFTVTATVADAAGIVVGQATLTCQGMSVYASAQPVAVPAPGTYTVTVNAVQAAEANVGSGSASVTVSAAR